MTLTDERITAERLEQLLADGSIDMAHRALRLSLWEGDPRGLDLLSLEIRDVDRAGRATGACGRAVPEDEGTISERAGGRTAAHAGRRPRERPAVRHGEPRAIRLVTSCLSGVALSDWLRHARILTQQKTEGEG
ncbi:hypothetical protein [Streptomyces sp. CNQ085]|uniref:hypothetical protein n=1 Tax=Streptomyces sp. CNQ085 TaxID=2886944 RepID=UPI001F50E7CB|nr:hypothetical protein [Streptomyces sp. CNQ085]MCI0385658.1 hypothetical protein [Streptomyces sp. CNQ085]